MLVEEMWEQSHGDHRRGRATGFAHRKAFRSTRQYNHHPLAAHGLAEKDLRLAASYCFLRPDHSDVSFKPSRCTANKDNPSSQGPVVDTVKSGLPSSPLQLLASFMKFDSRKTGSREILCA